jgi:hypothetical protein
MMKRTGLCVVLAMALVMGLVVNIPAGAQTPTTGAYNTEVTYRMVVRDDDSFLPSSFGGGTRSIGGGKRAGFLGARHTEDGERIKVCADEVRGEATIFTRRTSTPGRIFVSVQLNLYEAGSQSCGSQNRVADASSSGFLEEGPLGDFFLRTDNPSAFDDSEATFVVRVTQDTL